MVKAVAVLNSSEGFGRTVFFAQEGDGPTTVTGNISGLKPGLHGFMDPDDLGKEGKGGSTRLVVRKKLYKSSIQKAKETLRIKMIKAGLANKIEEKSVMAKTLIAMKKAAAETDAKYMMVNMRRDELMDNLIDEINNFEELRELENSLMRAFF